MFALPVTSLQEKEPRMKPTTIVMSLVLGLLALSLLGSFGSSAASDSRALAAASSNESALDDAKPTGQSQSDDEAGVDADLGKIGRSIGRETYLRLRDEYVARRRGIEPGRPFDPGARGRAIEQMERQEKGRLIDSILNGEIGRAHV